MPFWPTRTVTPGSRSTAARSYERKSVTSTRRTYMSERFPFAVRRSRLGGSADDGVAAELLAQCGDGLHGRRVDLAGFEPGEQRRGDHMQRHGEPNRLVDRPPALAGVLGVTLQLGQLRGAVEGSVEQVEQPG